MANYWINRFPICALVYKEAAELIGYDEDEAKSLGLTRSIFFAAARNGMGHGYKSKKEIGKFQSIDEMRKRQRETMSGVDEDSYDVMNFCGLGIYFVTKDERIRGFIGGKIITPEQFDRDVRDRIARGSDLDHFVLLSRFIKDGLSKLTKAELNSKAVFSFYEKIRDEVREQDFLKDLENGYRLITGENYVGISAETVLNNSAH